MKIRNLVSQLVGSFTVGKKPPRYDIRDPQPSRVIASRKIRKRQLAKILAEKKAGLR